MYATRETLFALIDAGVGCIDLSRRVVEVDLLVEVARAARQRGAKLKVSGNKPRHQLMQIVEAGGGAVEVVFFPQ
jgi:hypothetical protein